VGDFPASHVDENRVQQLLISILGSMMNLLEEINQLGVLIGSFPFHFHIPRPSKYPQIRWFTRLFLASLHFLGGIWQVYMTVSENGKCILIGQMNPLGF
jgi:hypothetical protein